MKFSSGVSRAVFPIVAILLAGPAPAAMPPRFTPQDPQQVLAPAAVPGDALGRELRVRHRALQQEPDNLDRALAFATTAIARGRAEQDARHFAQAELALARWWVLPEPPPAARLQRAIVRQWQHRFAEARADLDALIAAGGATEVQARLLRAALAQLQGDPARAAEDCRALFGKTDLLSAGACLATADGLRGQGARALASLETLLAAAPADSPQRRWAQTSAAELAARLGADHKAETHYRAALAAMRRDGVRDPYLLASYADFLLDRQRPAEVLTLLAGLERLDGLLLRLAMAADRSGDEGRREAWIAQLDAGFREEIQRGEAPHAREYARYLLELRGDAAAALPVALDNWREQREPIDARLLFAAAQAAGRPDAAQALHDWLRVTGLEDRALHAAPDALTGVAR